MDQSSKISYPANPPPYSGPQQSVPMAQVQPVVMNQPGPQIITTAGPMFVAAHSMGPEPAMVICPSCQYQIVTKADATPGTKTHLWALCLCVFGFWPCAWIPYCTPGCMNVTHTCPNCNSFVGTY